MTHFLRYLAPTALFAVALIAPRTTVAQYTPDDPVLYDTIMRMDSIFFAAYNTCNVHLDEYASMYTDDLEFYHDKGGLMTAKKDVVASTKKFVCGKVTRELVPGSVEVYPIANYGAVEIGFHKFHNNTEPPDTPSHAGRFVLVWRHTDKGWKIARVISLH